MMGPERQIFPCARHVSVSKICFGGGLMFILYKTEFKWFSDRSREVNSTLHPENYFSTDAQSRCAFKRE